MTALKWHQYIDPVLRVLADGQVHEARDAITIVEIDEDFFE